MSEDAKTSEAKLAKSKELYDAVGKEELKDVQRLLEEGADPNLYVDEDKDTALHIAARDGHIDIVLSLLEAKANPEARNDTSQTPRNVAVRWGRSYTVKAIDGAIKQAQMVALLMSMHSRAGSASPPAQAASHSSIFEPQTFRGMLSRSLPPGPSLLAVRKLVERNEALITAIADGDVEKVRQLLKAGADPNFRHNDQSDEPTPLYKACSDLPTAAETIKVLLAAGADPRLKTRGLTPFHLACGTGRIEVVKALLAAPPINALEEEGLVGLRALHFAASNGHEEVVAKLLEAGADLDARQYSDKTARDLAFDKGHNSIVALIDAERARRADRLKDASPASVPGTLFAGTAAEAKRSEAAGSPTPAADAKQPAPAGSTIPTVETPSVTSGDAGSLDDEENAPNIDPHPARGPGSGSTD